ncbi:MAG: hypothetical protein AB1467_03350 [Candidatus Diapherotrites archaeon]
MPLTPLDAQKKEEKRKQLIAGVRRTPNKGIMISFVKAKKD